jgi:hypothetical protein
MPRLETVNDLIAEVRSLIDEASTVNVQDTDILMSLNRAQSQAFSILAKHYPEPLLTTAMDTLVVGTRVYEMPENVFEDRLDVVEVFDGTFYTPLQRLSYIDGSKMEDASVYPYPTHYYIAGRTIRLVQKPAASYQLRIWYLREPDTLVKQQGRISAKGSDYVIVEGIGSTLSTVEDSLNNYLNIVDGQTGAVKQTLQINNISGSKITFRSSVTRTSGAILNRTLSTSVSTDVELDDYVCFVQGTCVPFFLYPIKNFMLNTVVGEIKGKQDRDRTMERNAQDDFIRQLESSSGGRASTKRISNKRGRR